MSDEEIIFKDHNVTITPVMAIFKNKSILIKDIRGVDIDKRNIFLNILFIIKLLCILAAIVTMVLLSRDFCFLGIIAGLIIGVLGQLLVFILVRLFSINIFLKVTFSNKRETVFEHKDPEYIQKIYDLLNEAIEENVKKLEEKENE